MQPGDGAFGHVDTELEKLTMNSRGAPEKVCGGHARDQGPNLVVDARQGCTLDHLLLIE